jgi:hypothetical protein
MSRAGLVGARGAVRTPDLFKVFSVARADSEQRVHRLLNN